MLRNTLGYRFAVITGAFVALGFLFAFAQWLIGAVAVMYFIVPTFCISTVFQIITDSITKQKLKPLFTKKIMYAIEFICVPLFILASIVTLLTIFWTYTWQAFVENLKFWAAIFAIGGTITATTQIIAFNTKGLK